MYSTLKTIERWGNRLPHPTVLFFYLCLIIVALSAVMAQLGVKVISPVSQQEITALSLLSRDGLQYFLLNAVKNFVSFAPVGTVLVAMLGLGIAEHSGLLPALLKKIVTATPSRYLPVMVVFLGILSSVGADSGYVILIPLAGLLYLRAGMHPIAGIATAFAGVSAGYSANLVITPIDALLSGISQEAAKIVAPDTLVPVTANYYFLIASTFVITVICGLVAYFFTGQQTGNITYDSPKEDDHLPTDTRDIENKQNRALKITGIAFCISLLLVIAGSVPAEGFLRGDNGSLVNSPLTRGVVVIISLIAALCGIIYGFVSGQYQRTQDCIEGMEKHMATMAGYLVLMFFAAQFVAFFNWSQLGAIVAIGGAGVLQTLQLPTSVLLILFVFFAAFINLFIGSASAKWALLAPIFVPMLLLTGITPDATQMAFRIGDSCTNIITPLMPYFGVVIAFMQHYNKNIGSGTIIALMLPYSIALLLSWTVFFGVWLALEIPLGP